MSFDLAISLIILHRLIHSRKEPVHSA